MFSFCPGGWVSAHPPWLLQHRLDRDSRIVVLQRSNEELPEGARRPDRHDPARESCTEILRQREEVSALRRSKILLFYQFVLSICLFLRRRINTSYPKSYPCGLGGIVYHFWKLAWCALPLKDPQNSHICRINTGLQLTSGQLTLITEGK